MQPGLFFFLLYHTNKAVKDFNVLFALAVYDGAFSDLDVVNQFLNNFPVKLLHIQIRRTAEEVRGSIYYRWFLGYTLQEETPHFSTVSYNFRHRFTAETVDQIFTWILNEIAEAGYCRVAHDDGFSLEAQGAELRRYAEQAGYTIVGAADEHSSGLTLDRPALQKVTEASSLARWIWCW